jgi:putative hemolysin
MQKNILLICLILSIQYEFLKGNKINQVTPETWCHDSNGQVINSYAQMSTYTGTVNGLEAQFCLISNNLGNLAMIDLQTLVSTRPNFAATYVLKGIDYANIPKKNIWEICQSLRGTSIGFYTSGGWVNQYGQDEICVFPDGSKVSTWALVYLSSGNPNYLGLRSRIRSSPLALNLPYLGKSAVVGSVPFGSRQVGSIGDYKK